MTHFPKCVERRGKFGAWLLAMSVALAAAVWTEAPHATPRSPVLSPVSMASAPISRRTGPPPSAMSPNVLNARPVLPAAGCWPIPWPRKAWIANSNVSEDIKRHLGEPR